MHYEFRVLGHITAEIDGCEIDVPTKPRALLAMLLLNANRLVSVASLRDALWGSTAPPSALHNLRTYVSGLRRVLHGRAEPRITAHPAAYRIVVRPGELDLDAFLRGIGAGRAALAAGDPHTAAQASARALRLWRDRPHTEHYGRSLASLLTMLDDERLAAVECFLDARVQLGDGLELLPLLRREIADDPLRERMWVRLMIVLYRAGRAAAALDAFNEARHTLINELGIEPGQELHAAQAAVLRRDSALLGPAALPWLATPVQAVSTYPPVRQ